MPKKINYSSLFTLRKDGRYQASYIDNAGTRHFLYDRDPERLYDKMQTVGQPKDPTFAEIADEWEDARIPLLAYKTQEAYRAPLKRLKAQFGAKLIKDITAAQIQAYITDISRRGYARRTVQMSLDILRMIFVQGILQGAIQYNPVDAVSIPNGLATAHRDMPTDAELQIVKNSVDAPFGLFAVLCLYTGLRRGEALALRYEDIDRSTMTITVNKAVEFVGNQPQIKTPKTAAGNRTVVLLDPLAAVLPTGNGYIFSDGGNLLTKIQYRRRWQKYLDATGLSITAHQLRHGYATILYEAGIPDKDAQELLGHSNITVTRNVYTHIRQSRKDDITKQLNQFVNSH